MDLGTMLSVAQTLFAALQCSDVKEISSTLGYKSELDSLSSTVSTIRAVLLDAESKQQVSREAQLWIQELRDAVYDADDLLDWFTSLAGQKQLMKGGKASKKACLVFSHFNPLGVAYNVSRGIKKIRKKLEAITNNHTQFGFSVDYQPVMRRRVETSSYINADNIVGREDDVEKIVSTLVDTDLQQGVSFLTIVGMGGLGKTTLAQLVYNDKRITREFPLRLWTCVSDQDQQTFDVKDILGKILESASGKKHDGYSMDWVQGRLRDQLAGCKYLLVLDDVWTENRDQWLNLAEFLTGGQRGSWIVVTTRSRGTGRVIGNGPTYELNGLSEDNSWRLFEKIAFKQSREQANSPDECDDMVKIGQEIVKQCANVPLAIRVIGSFLYGQGKTKWLSFQQISLANIRQGENCIMPMLKLSYHHLDSQLKSCFSYCALFPKNYNIKKDMLISLWMAQGYIVPLDNCQKTEDAAEEYFSILVERCFFQDVQRDAYGEIVSCKLHDLMHDLAQEVAGKEIYAANSIILSLDRKYRHLSIAECTFTESSFTNTKIRTFLQFSWMQRLYISRLLANCLCLRALQLRNSGINSIPDTIGKLLHLRYLDLSSNDMESLPNSVTNLYNLQTLNLSWCSRLRELPKDLSKLVKLRVLDVEGCYGLTYMPANMGKLTHLCTLTRFLVNESCSSSMKCCGQLEDLKALTELKGQLDIQIKFSRNNTTYHKGGSRNGSYLRSKKHLNYIGITCKNVESDGRTDREEAVLEDLQPCSNLKGLKLEGYCGMRLPVWARENNLATTLPNLVRMDFVGCQELLHLPRLGQLRYLKVLKLKSLPNLEYIVNNAAASVIGTSTEELLFFPSLGKLFLDDLPKLKGWWRGARDDLQEDRSSKASNSIQPHLLPSFPSLSQLKELHIHKCPELISLPRSPYVEDLNLRDFNRRLHMIRSTNKGLHNGREQSFLSHPTLRSVDTDNIVWLKSLPIEDLQSLSEIDILWDKELESLSEVEEIFSSCSSSLRTLRIAHCPNLRSISKGLEHLTALETLVIKNNPNVISLEDENGMPWRALHHNLHSLSLGFLPNLETLPESIQCLASLHSLTIKGCEELDMLPESLQKLES